MKNRPYFSLFLVCCLLFSVFGLTLQTASAQPAAVQPAAVQLAAPAGFDKDSPGQDVTVTTLRVLLSWKPSTTPGVTYEYCFFPKKECPQGQYRLAGANTSVTISVKPGTTYLWQVRARGADGSLTYANGGFWKFTTVSAAPSTFSKLSPAPGAPPQPVNVTLTWSTSTGLNVNYQVCYDTTNNNTCDNNLWRTAGSGTSYTLTGLSYSTTYYWQVRAYNSKGTAYANGSATSFYSFTTRIAPPTPFVKLAPANAASGMPLNINLTWSPSTGTALTYQYCLVASLVDNTCEGSGGAWISTAANTYAAPAGLEYNRTYYWQVRALNNSDPNDATVANGGTWFSFSTLTNQPSGFGKLLPVSGIEDVSRTPTLYWSASTADGVTYRYCLVQSGQPCNNWTSTGTNTFARVTTLLGTQTPYQWQVEAVTGTGSTPADDGLAWTFTTLPAPPQWIVETFSTPEDPAAPYTADLNATNPVGKTLTYALVGLPPAGSFNLQPNGVFTYTPELDYNGLVTFAFTISDGVNPPSGPYTANITVTAVNDAPSIVAIEDIQAVSGSDIFFSIEVSDADLIYGDTLDITLIGTLPSGATFVEFYDATTHAASADFEWLGATWSPAHPGPYTFTFRVTDLLSAAAEDAFSITILPQPAEWIIETFSTPEDPPLPYTADLNATNPDGQTLTYTLVAPPPAGTFQLSPNGVFTFTPVANYNGAVTFSFTISDGLNLPSEPYTATINVTAVNDAPSVVSIQDVRVVSGTPITFRIETRDPDLAYGDILDITLIGTLPSGATFVENVDPVTHAAYADFVWTNPRWLPAHTGPYTFTLRVKDNLNVTAEDSFTITITPEQVFLPFLRK